MNIFFSLGKNKTCGQHIFRYKCQLETGVIKCKIHPEILITYRVCGFRKAASLSLSHLKKKVKVAKSSIQLLQKHFGPLGTAG